MKLKNKRLPHTLYSMLPGLPKLHKLSMGAMLPILALSLVLQSCGVYSFTGASIDYSKVKTISVQPFFNDSGLGPSNMGQFFTEQLRDYYIQNTQLSLVDFDGDLQVEGSITNWRTQPVAPTAAATANVTSNASLQRVTITVKVAFLNLSDEEQNFNKSFSFYADYDPASESLTAAEQRLMEEIFESIVLDIFNATVANW